MKKKSKVKYKPIFGTACVLTITATGDQYNLMRKEDCEAICYAIFHQAKEMADTPSMQKGVKNLMSTWAYTARLQKQSEFVQMVALNEVLGGLAELVILQSTRTGAITITPLN